MRSIAPHQMSKQAIKYSNLGFLKVNLQTKTAIKFLKETSIYSFMRSFDRKAVFYNIYSPRSLSSSSFWCGYDTVRVCREIIVYGCHFVSALTFIYIQQHSFIHSFIHTESDLIKTIFICRAIQLKFNIPVNVILEERRSQGDRRKRFSIFSFCCCCCFCFWIRGRCTAAARSRSRVYQFCAQKIFGHDLAAGRTNPWSHSRM